MQIRATNEWANLKKVVVGAQSMGGTPALEEAYDPKSRSTLPQAPSRRKPTAFVNWTPWPHSWKAWTWVLRPRVVDLDFLPAMWASWWIAWWPPA